MRVNPLGQPRIIRGVGWTAFDRERLRVSVRKAGAAGARATRCMRLLASSLFIRWSAWDFTVFTLINSRSAICALSSPSDIKRSTSSSRSLGASLTIGAAGLRPESSSKARSRELIRRRRVRRHGPVSDGYAPSAGVSGATDAAAMNTHQVFLDESGNTGDHFSDRAQRSLLASSKPHACFDLCRVASRRIA